MSTNAECRKQLFSYIVIKYKGSTFLKGNMAVVSFNILHIHTSQPNNSTLRNLFYKNICTSSQCVQNVKCTDHYKKTENNQNIHQSNSKLWYICNTDQIQPLERMYLSGKISKKLLSEKTNELPSGKPSGKSEQDR